MTWTTLPAGTAASMALRKRMNSWCRWRCMQRPRTVPSRMLRLGEQRGGAMALVVVGHGAGAALLQGQAGLGAVECLDLALLVDRQHHAMGRRVDVEADDVAQLRHELGIVGELEAADAVRRQAVRPPDALDRGDADAGLSGILCAGP